jgi:NTE family protein
MSTTEAWLLEPDAFLEITGRFPAIWRNFGRVLSQRLARTSRHLAVRPFANTTILVIDLPDEEAAVIAYATAASVARQTAQSTLLVDCRTSQAWPATPAAPLKAGPSFPALLKDQALLAEHEAPATDANGTAEARVSLLRGPDEPQIETRDALEILDWLRRFYHYIIVLGETGSSELRRELLRSGASLSVVISEDSHELPSWVGELSNSVQSNAKFKVSILTGDLADTSLIQSIENETGRAVRRLPISRAAVRELGSRKPIPTGTGDERLRTGIDRLARQIAGKEVGLALGAGAAKGFAHIGVLTALRENDIPIDFLVGTSIGAVVAALFVCGVPLDEIQFLLQGADRKLARWTLPLHSVWSDSGLVQLLKGHGQTTRFRDLPIPFATVATDITSGREAVLRRGLVWKAVQASVTVPGIFPPAANRGRVLVDGGLVNPVPGQTVRDLGADIVVAVDLMTSSARSADHSNTRRLNGDSPKLRIPNLVEIMWRSNEIMQEEVTLRSAATADLTIEPKLGRVRWSDFSKRGREYRAAGEEAAREKLAEIWQLVARAVPRG